MARLLFLLYYFTFYHHTTAQDMPNFNMDEEQVSLSQEWTRKKSIQIHYHLFSIQALLPAPSCILQESTIFHHSLKLLRECVLNQEAFIIFPQSLDQEKKNTQTPLHSPHNQENRHMAILCIPPKSHLTLLL